MATNDDLALDNPSVQMPLCHSCYEHVKVSLYTKHPDGSLVLAWPYVEDKVILTNDSTECGLRSPWCLGKSDAINGDSTSCSGGNPNVCDSHDAGEKAQHNKILACISEIEAHSRELEVGYGVTKSLEVQIQAAREVDPSVPSEITRAYLSSQSKSVLKLMHGDDEIKTASGHPLCITHCGTTFDCHHSKMLHYAPASCGCTPTACSCTNCILHHVSHCVEDYRAAVKMVRVDISKLRAMPRQDTALPSSSHSNQTSTQGCAMPGVRKGKHLKNFAKAQKDSYNHGE